MRNTFDRFVSGGEMLFGKGSLGLSFAVLALLASAGCARGALDVPAARQLAARTTSSSAVPEGAPTWAQEDARLYLSRPTDFDRLAVSIVTSAGLVGEARDVPAFQNDAFVALTGASGDLSRHSAVWFETGPAAGSGFVYFDNGASDYPVADGLVYSASPTATPPYRSVSDDVSDAVLSTPTPVAPHWWAAAWDPTLFYNGISYDGRDYSAVDSAMQVDPHRLPGPTTVVAGRVVGGVTYEDESNVDIDVVDVGGSKPVPVLTNPHTVRHTVSTSDLHKYRVRIGVLPGGRQLAFALDVWE